MTEMDEWKDKFRRAMAAQTFAYPEAELIRDELVTRLLRLCNEQPRLAFINAFVDVTMDANLKSLKAVYRPCAVQEAIQSLGKIAKAIVE